MKIQAYEVIDHGVESEQYFQGCGTSFTNYDDVATGCGHTKAEALEDALEQLSCTYDNTECVTDEMDAETPVCEGCEWADHDDEGEAGTNCDMCEAHFYVSVRVKRVDPDDMSFEDFQDRFEAIVGRMSTAELLAIPGVYDSLREVLNNDVIEDYEEDKAL